jgi:prepilin-type N-terminal cleavage/methylation domain-containing protein
MKNILHIKNSYSKGFTLIETLVGLFIFVLAFTALSQVSGGSLQDISLTKRKLTAQYLAEEGVEYVKYLQKSVIFNSDPTFDFNNLVNDCISGGCNLYFDPNLETVIPTTTYDLKYCPNGLIGDSLPFNCTTPSEYSRIISVDPISTTVYKITSSVTYSNQLTVQPVTVSTIIHFPF